MPNPENTGHNDLGWLWAALRNARVRDIEIKRLGDEIRIIADGTEFTFDAAAQSKMEILRDLERALGVPHSRRQKAPEWTPEMFYFCW